MTREMNASFIHSVQYCHLPRNIIAANSMYVCWTVS